MPTGGPAAFRSSPDWTRHQAELSWSRRDSDHGRPAARPGRPRRAAAPRGDRPIDRTAAVPWLQNRIRLESCADLQRPQWVRANGLGALMAESGAYNAVAPV